MVKGKKNNRYILILALIFISACAFFSLAFIAKGTDSPQSEGTNLPTPGVIEKESLAPMNNLQILDNMDGATVTVVAHGTGVAYNQTGSSYEIHTINKDTESDGNADLVDKSLSQGDFWGSSDSSSVGLYNSMYKSMRAGTGDTAFGGIAVLFNGSDTNAEDYDSEYRAGWSSDDLSLDTTTMWLELEYTNVGYYKGKKINAIAKISITPSKNRNSEARWNHQSSDGYNYRGTYQPMIQISNSLYRGWVWQNVEQFKIDLQFYYADDTTKTPISFGGDASYDSLNADYYVINSLNPTRDTTDWETQYAHYI